MVDPLALLALGLLVLGVAGCVVPLLPGPLLSLAGVLCYWWQSGYTEPSSTVLVALTVVGVVAFLADYLSGAVSAAAGGGSLVTSALAGVVGIVLLLTGTGPLGFVLGVIGTVFVAEFYRNRDPKASARTAAYTVVGMLASTVVQLLVTLTMLVAMVAVAFL